MTGKLRVRRHWLLPLLVTFGLLIAWDAKSHQANISISEHSLLPDRQIVTALTLEGVDLDVALTRQFTIVGGIVNPHIVSADLETIIGYVRPRISVHGPNGKMCIDGKPEIEASYQSVIYTVAWDCRDVDGELFFSTTLFLNNRRMRPILPY